MTTTYSYQYICLNSHQNVFEYSYILGTEYTEK